ncbi:CoF synthetase [Winogradskyella flava]|uniref:CoF synthetase n=1 Tax=Winogradskyella flava TaxID=1884876 RepID=UPI002492F2D1|nr:CoF synthetase [Winogradskyella flava]
MTPLELLRNYFFWFLDFFKTYSIRKHYKEIKLINENPADIKAVKLRERNLKNLIAHACRTTSYYSKLKSREFDDFPIINKNLILNNFEDFSSNLYQKKDLIKHSTSGSTGVPFEIYKDKNKVSRNSADVIYFSELANYKLGNRLVYIRLWVKKFMRNKYVFFFQNVIPHDVLKNSWSEINDFLNMLKSMSSKKVLLTYPSYLEEVCRFLDSKESDTFNYNIKSIITTSEKLNAYEKERSEYFFKCPVYERYSNMENGILAQKTFNLRSSFKINHASYIIEVLNIKTNEHVNSGEVGKIVITDLFNYATPLLRYDTGDLGRYEIKGDSEVVLSEIFGRRLDAVYNTQGKFVSPHIFYKISHFSKLKQYQFIQNKASEYTFKLNAKKEDTQEDAIINHFQPFLGQDASFNFVYVDEIALLESGKFKKVVNLMS